MDDLWNAIVAMAICIFIIATFVWLTWYVVIWLAAAAVLYLVFRQSAKRAAQEQEIFGTVPGQ